MTTAGDPNLRHLLARAVAVEQRIRRAVEARQLTDPDPDDAFRGLYLTDENIARLLDENEARAFPYPVPDATANHVPGSARTTYRAPLRDAAKRRRNSPDSPPWPTSSASPLSTSRSSSSRSYRISTTASRPSTAT